MSPTATTQHPRIGSLFSGAGGLDLAVEHVFGGRTVWQCELDPAAAAVLAYRWPGVPNLGDITAVDWSAVELVDVLCGGFPCQDVSAAGRRAGIQAGTRSGLWAMFADAIAGLRPRYVVIENVRGLLSADGEPWPTEVQAADAEVQRLGRVVALIKHKIDKAIRNGWWHGEHKRRKQSEAARMARQRDRALARFRSLRRRLVQRAIGTVVGDLADLGYDTQWTTVSAASVGAPHKRERIFILATPTDAGHATEHGQRSCAEPWRRDQEPAADTPGERRTDIERCGYPAGQPVSTEPGAGSGDRSRPTAAGIRELPGTAAELATVSLLPTTAASRSGRNRSASDGAAIRPSIDSITDLLPTPAARDGKGANPNRQGGLDLPGALLPTPAASDANRGPDLARANRAGSGGDDLHTFVYKTGRTQQWGKYAAAIARWVAVTRPAPSPTEPNTKGNPYLAPAFPEWMQGWPAGWVTAVPGISRNDMLRIIGNGVCPQQATAALSQLLAVCRVAA
ncbi:DNA cytosine methyltransferase [Mycolicibacterium canariasense]|uniref:DNA cytosine methyltransferase n=1 Tax=Mycolicibacterium canariasense TaxID=228230 RepID=UPI000A148561|nr:DNA cytosine methyltransferase [Mycolicibacterium canariasense]MCV7208348.1 DNA cytosine methyltransferase [Mycolicibacterium canariasense]